MAGKKNTKAKNKSTSVKSEPAGKRVKRSHQTIEDGGGGDGKEWMPKNWPEAYENMKQMMEGVRAPLESMPWYQAYDPEKTTPEERFKVLVALMLSSQTKDEQTLKTWEILNEKGLSVDWLLEIDEGELSEIIRSVNFRKNKAKYLKAAAKIIKEKYDGDVPDTLEGLVELPGVGNKMAFLVLQSVWNKVDGLGVDTHVHRVTNRLGWVRRPAKSAEQCRTELESWVPKDIWFDFNRLVTRFGQMKCLPKNPACKDCLNNEICPSAFKE